ncbi:MAG: hypothetical protein H0W69_00700 [Gemmatimonadaceae bacterium]|nr:hypothetical protein [Gemmatimonadaceae bacterium]
MLLGSPALSAAQNSDKLMRIYESLLPTTGVNVRDQGAVGDSLADDTQALRRAYAAVPDGGTMLIPRGKYRVTSPLHFNRRVSVVGEGIGSILWIMCPPTDGAAVQFGVPFADSGVVTCSIGNFSVQGTSNNNSRHGIAFYRIYDCNVGPLYVMPGSQSHAVMIGGCLQTFFDIVQEQNFAAFEPDRVVFPAGGIPTRASGPGTLRIVKKAGAGWRPNTFLAKGLVVAAGSGHNAASPGLNFYRILSNTTDEVTLDRNLPVASDASTVFTIADSLAYPQSGCTVCVVNVEDLPGYNRARHGVGMPTNACTIRVRQSGGSGRSTGGLLVRPQQQLGGNNLYTGKIEGNSNPDKLPAELGGGYGMVIVGGVNWKIRDMHVEGNENGSIVAETSQFSITDSLFSPIGNTPAESEKLRLGPRAQNFAVNSCTIGLLSVDSTSGGYAMGHCDRNVTGPGSFGISAPPRSGAWRSGDRIFYDPLPSNARFVGAVCLESGTPGRWREFGSIS